MIRGSRATWRGRCSERSHAHSFAMDSPGAASFGGYHVLSSVTELSSRFATHTSVPSKAMAAGKSPTGSSPSFRPTR